jgi:hypothetical protein
MQTTEPEVLASVTRDAMDVLKVVDGLTGNFSTDEVVRGLKYQFPKTAKRMTRNTVLWKLRVFRDKGWLRCANKGHGFANVSEHEKTDNFPPVDQVTLRSEYKPKPKRRPYHPPPINGLELLYHQERETMVVPKAGEIVFGLGRQFLDDEEAQ